MHKYFVLVGLMFFGYTSMQAQLDTDADFKRQVYDRAYTGGVSFHTRGYTLSGRFLKYLDGYNAAGFELDLVKIRHPKETISSEDIFNNYRGFVKGRINSFYSLRAGYVRERVLFDKTDQGSVSISYNFSGGLSLGVLKPIYLAVDEFTPDGDFVTNIIRYTGETNPANINGEANFLRGIEETNFKPGVYIKGGVSFDYQLLDDKITSVEAGVIYDYFFTEVPIFFESENDINWSGFFQLYITVNFGYKLN
jgi:hypothetical protein